jgi:hypothetical protein
MTSRVIVSGLDARTVATKERLVTKTSMSVRCS